jgi:hypothetical protein
MKTPTTPYEALLLSSAIEILKSDPRQDEGHVNGQPQMVDTPQSACFNKDSNPSTSTGELKMAKKPKNVFETVTPKAKQVDASTNGVETDADGNTVTHNPPAEREKSKQEIATEKAQAKIAEKAAKKEAADLAKAVKLAAKEAAKAAKSSVTAEQRQAAKEAREARLAELGKNYKGPMLALADRVKSGAYVKSATGQLRSTNELATVLDGVTPNGVIEIAKVMLKLESNPYSHLNVGQQSMNLRNKMRGAISKGELDIADVRAYITEHELDCSASLIREREAKAKRIADAKAEREAKKAAAELAKVTKVNEAAKAAETAVDETAAIE